MNRLGKACCGAALVLVLCSIAEAAEPLRLESPPLSAQISRSGVIAGAALALSQLAIWRNNMPRVIKPGEADPGSPMIVKAEVEVKNLKAATKLAYKVELHPGTGAPQALQNLEVNVDGKPWDGSLKAGDPTYIEFYSKAPGTLAPGSKAKLTITFTAGNETTKLEAETTVEKVD